MRAGSARRLSTVMPRFANAFWTPLSVGANKVTLEAGLSRVSACA